MYFENPKEILNVYHNKLTKSEKIQIVELSDDKFDRFLKNRTFTDEERENLTSLRETILESYISPYLNELRPKPQDLQTKIRFPCHNLPSELNNLLNEIRNKSQFYNREIKFENYRNIFSGIDIKNGNFHIDLTLWKKLGSGSHGTAYLHRRYPNHVLKEFKDHTNKYINDFDILQEFSRTVEVYKMLVNACIKNLLSEEAKLFT